MLYNLGTLAMDTRPFNADAVQRDGKASNVRKPVMGALPPVEFTGDDGSTLKISGQLLPFKTGGLSSFDAADQMRANGTRFPVVRGDGKALGWFTIDAVSESHRELMKDGVGFIVSYSITMTQVPGPSAGSGIGAGIVGALVDLFQALGR